MDRRNLVSASILGMVALAICTYFLMQGSSAEEVTTPSIDPPEIEMEGMPSAPPASIQANPYRPSNDAAIVELLGVVVGPAGEAVRGAQIVSSYATASGVRDSVSHTADEQGTFRLPLPADWLLMTVTSTATGYSPGVLPDVPAGVSSLRVIMAPHATLSGTITDDTGQPIPGATVVTHSRPPDPPYAHRVSADDAGHFHLSGVPRDLRIRCEAPGFGTRMLMSYGHSGESRLDIVLLRTTTLKARVVQAGDQSPCDRAHIELWSCELLPERGGAARSCHSERIQTTVTGPDGRFEIHGVPSVTKDYPLLDGSDSHLALWIRAPGRAPLWLQLPRTESPTLDLGDLEVHATGVIVGRVLQAAGEPVEGARVLYGHEKIAHERSLAETRSNPMRLSRLSGVPEGACLIAVTDSEGRYSMTVPAAVGQSPGGVLLLSDHSAKLFARVTPVPGGTTTAPDLVVPLAPDSHFYGKVVARDTGKPLAGARIGEREPAVLSGADGCFSMRLFPNAPVPEVNLLVIRAGYVTAWFPLDGGGRDAAAPLIIELAPAVSLSGDVVAGDGEPVRGALVRVFDGRIDPQEARNHRSYGYKKEMYGVTRTTEGGTFTFPRIPEGPYHVLAYFPSDTVPTVIGMRESISPGSSRVVVRLDEILPVPRDVVVQLRSESTGSPIDLLDAPQLSVAGAFRVGVRLSVGRYRFTGVAGDRASVILPAANRSRRTIDRAIPEDHILEVSVKDHPMIDAHVQFPPGVARADVSFDIKDPQSGTVVAKGHVRGSRLQIADLDEGTYIISLGAESQARYEMDHGGPLTVNVGATCEILDIRLNRR